MAGTKFPIYHVWQPLSVIRKDFNAKRLCLHSEIFGETAIVLMYPIHIEMSQSSNNLMRHSLHQAIYNETFEI